MSWPRRERWMVAAPRPWADMTQALLDVAREHQRTLQGSITRPELDAAARDVGEARASCRWAS